MEFSSWIFVTIVLKFLQTASFSSAAAFYNPILDTPSYYPNVYLHTDGYYYMVQGNASEMSVHKSESLSDWRLAERRRVYTVPVGYDSLGSFNIRFFEDDWYIYFRMQNVALKQYHMFVIKAENSYNPLGRYRAENRLTPATPEEGYDEWEGMVAEFFDGRYYFIYSGLPSSTSTIRKLYLAPMSNPTTIIGSRTLIRDTTTAWDKDTVRLPFALVGDNSTFLTFTGQAAGVTSIGMMGIDEGKDPLVAQDWWHLPDPVFIQNAEANVWNSHCLSFTSSPDLSETWILYQASQTNVTAGPKYTTRVQKILWDAYDAPFFPTPVGLATALPQPSGEL